ncbi:RNA polymerase factor sigma-54 [Blattabacterium cuenoti]|uniref:RNA polymerase factor sigma-54 n=1 Tax=Blattabacterium cuenoti TaxID=1653831 RepID=UPI00163C0668|nr:RNA polymerase factor sigma-54 [Blattabacterium cuenoti]
MLKQQLYQKGQHKLSPKQIKLMKLVQLSILDFEQKVRQELDNNPALEEESSSFREDPFEDKNNTESLNEKDSNLDNNNIEKESEISDIDEYMTYLSDDELEEFKLINHQNFKKNNNYTPIIASKYSFQEYLKNQLHTFRLNSNDLLIADFILGNIDDDGYLRRKSELLSNDIFIVLGKSVSTEKIEQLIVKYIQKLDPIGIGSRNLQECLLIQLNMNKNFSIEYNSIAKEIIKNNFESFIKKHYKKLQKKLRIDSSKLKNVFYLIKKLNPKPGKMYSENNKILDYIIPDFTISIVDERLELTLHHRNAPELRVSNVYLNMLKKYTNNNKKNDKKTVIFIKNKINSAKWFVDAVKQRQNTLMLTMNAIMNYQKEYFITGDPIKIKPMILKNISKKTGLGISTVSRVANSKYVNTPYGTFLIKNFFSEKMKNKYGKYISSIEIKNFLGEFIFNENKKNPLTDEKLSKILKKNGYIIARRTIAKYRNQMKIPVARMRKTIL